FFFSRRRRNTKSYGAGSSDVCSSDLHSRTRLTHTLEMSQIARTMARALRMNEDVTEAIALAHDLGHTPFGHAGEDILRKIFDPEIGRASCRERVEVSVVAVTVTK